MIEPVAELLIDVGLVASVFGAVFGTVFYIPYRIEKPKTALLHH